VTNGLTALTGGGISGGLGILDGVPAPTFGNFFAACKAAASAIGSGIFFAKRPQPQTPEDEADAHGLAGQGERILGKGHDPGKIDAFNDWWGTLKPKQKAWYDWADGPRPSRR
jgi:hypothetical protein